MNKRQRKKMATKYGIERLKPYKRGEPLKDTLLAIRKCYQYYLDMQRDIIETAPKTPWVLPS